MSKIIIRIPNILLEQITAMAKQEGLSVNDFIVELVSLGLFDLEESDKHEERSQLN